MFIVDICAQDCFYYKKCLKVLSSQCFSAPRGSWQLCSRACLKWLTNSLCVINYVMRQFQRPVHCVGCWVPWCAVLMHLFAESLSSILPLQKLKFCRIGGNGGQRVCVAVNPDGICLHRACQVHVRVLPWHTVCLVFVLVYVVLC